MLSPSVNDHGELWPMNIGQHNNYCSTGVEAMCKVCISSVGFNCFVESLKGNKGVVRGFDLIGVL